MSETLAAAVDEIDSSLALHSSAIAQEDAVEGILQSLQRQAVPLHRSKNKNSIVETAFLTNVGASVVSLECQNLSATDGDELLLQFELAGRPYFLVSRVLRVLDDRLEASRPSAIYRSERRDRVRQKVSDHGRAKVRGQWVACTLVDESPGGVGAAIETVPRVGEGEWVQLDIPRHRETRFTVRRASERKVGLRVAPEPGRTQLRELRLDDAQPEISLGAGPVAEASRFDFLDSGGARIAALVDGDLGSANMAVVIPSAWGRTKETLAPLADVLIRTFEANGIPSVVLRFDGVGKRGDSDRTGGSVAPGHEFRDFSFSRSAEDLRAALDFLGRNGVKRSVVVSFSISAVETRKVVAERSDVVGWVSVVGATDAQSIVRATSGGVDFFGRVERGEEVGDQELQGLLIDMDLAATDAIANGYAFLEDAFSDMARIECPIVWMHGRDDAWSDPERAREMLSFGSTEVKMIEMPVGHHLRSSHEASVAFARVAAEASRMLSPAGSATAVLPTPEQLVRRVEAERRESGVTPEEVRAFWERYLVGRDGAVGMEIVADGADHRLLMAQQVEQLEASDGDLVLDLGCGLGPAIPRIDACGTGSQPVRYVGLDYVLNALRGASATYRPAPGLVASNLSLGEGSGLPFVDRTFDGALASLLLNYVDAPEELLSELRRVIVPGGTLVLSALRRDADTSRICARTVEDLRSHAEIDVGKQGVAEASLQGFINDAARLLDYEEAGVFHFWSSDELLRMVEVAGFGSVRSREAFGVPPQATLVTAIRTA